MVLGLLIREGREAVRAPVNDAVAAVDQPFLPQAHECLAHRAGVGRVEREARTAPIARAADDLELLDDGVARLAHERPHPLDERLPAHVEPSLPLRGQLLLHHVLGGDAGVIGPREPLGGPAAHALEADEDVLDDVVQGVPDVQHGGEVRGRDDDDVRLPRGSRQENVAFEPALIQARLDGAWVVLRGKLELRAGHSLI